MMMIIIAGMLFGLAATALLLLAISTRRAR